MRALLMVALAFLAVPAAAQNSKPYKQPSMTGTFYFDFGSTALSHRRRKTSPIWPPKPMQPATLTSSSSGMRIQRSRKARLFRSSVRRPSAMNCCMTGSRRKRSRSAG
jgi:hypothetical protein